MVNRKKRTPRRSLRKTKIYDGKYDDKPQPYLIDKSKETERFPRPLTLTEDEQFVLLEQRFRNLLEDVDFTTVNTNQNFCVLL
jgi:hypothetical protein